MSIGDSEVCNLVERVYAEIESQSHGESDAHVNIPRILAAVYFAKKLCGCFSVSAEDRELIIACCLLWGAVDGNRLGSKIHHDVLSAEPSGQIRKLGELFKAVQGGAHQLDPLPEPALIVLLSHKILSPQGPVLQVSRPSKDDGLFPKAA
jgi:hypothetical protein